MTTIELHSSSDFKKDRFMPNTKVQTTPNTEFQNSLADFIQYLAIGQNKSVYHEVGRKFVKIIIENGVRYFVEKSTGNIYGSKSRLAPNLHHYFGTIYNASKWDWSGYYGVSVSDTSVRAIKRYGPYTHYIPV